MKHVVEKLLSANTHGRFLGLLTQQFNLENREKNTRKWQRLTAKLLPQTDHKSTKYKQKGQLQVIEQQN